MRTSNGGFSVAANVPRRDVDNRISLQKYYRIADNLLKQADIFRGEKNVLDLYIMLLRFSSLITEIIPSHKDYKSSLQEKKVLFRKKLLNTMNELEVLKPVVQQRIDEMNRKAKKQLDGRGHFQSDYNNSSLEWPPAKIQVPNNKEVKNMAAIILKRLQQSEPEKVPIPDDSSSELERSTLESVYSSSVDSQPMEPSSAITLDSGMMKAHIQTNIIRQLSISPVLAEVQDTVAVTTPPVSDSGVEFDSLQDELHAPILRCNCTL